MQSVRGALVNKTLIELRNLIATMVANSQLFSAMADHPPRKISKVKTCGICFTVRYPTDKCPTLQENNYQ